MVITCENESGECATQVCGNKESSAWYGKKGAKYCKHCYDTIHSKKKQKLSAAQQEVEHALAGDTLVEIIEIYAKRCSHTPRTRDLGTICPY